MEVSELLIRVGCAVVAYLVLLGSGILFRYRRLSRLRATLAGGVLGALMWVVVAPAHFDPVGPSVATILITTVVAALSMRYTTTLLDRLFRTR
jgi:uncharacterized membrane protein